MACTNGDQRPVKIWSYIRPNTASGLRSAWEEGWPTTATPRMCCGPSHVVRARRFPPIQPPKTDEGSGILRSWSHRRARDSLATSAPPTRRLVSLGVPRQLRGLRRGPYALQPILVRGGLVAVSGISETMRSSPTRLRLHARRPTIRETFFGFAGPEPFGDCARNDKVHRGAFRIEACPTAWAGPQGLGAICLALKPCVWRSPYRSRCKPAWLSAHACPVIKTPIRAPALRARWDKLTELVLFELMPAMTRPPCEVEVFRRRVKMILLRVMSGLRLVVLLVLLTPSRSVFSPRQVALARRGSGTIGSELEWSNAGKLIVGSLFQPRLL